MSHLIFFDRECKLCRRAVNRILKRDVEKVFFFAPLEGKTAQKFITSSLKAKNSLVLVEDYLSSKRRIWIRARAIFRIFWLLNWPWKGIGCLCFIPVLPDLLYRFVASHRHFFSDTVAADFSKDDQGRFLP